MPTRTGGIGIDWDGNETVSKQHELVNSKNLCKTNSTITTGRSSSASFSSTSLASIALNNKGIHKMIPPWLEGSDVIVRTKEQCNINEACSDTDEDDDDYDEPMRIVSTNYSRGFRNVAESTGKFTHYNTVVHPMIIDEHSSLKKQSKKTLRSMLCGKQKKKQNFSSDELRWQQQQQQQHHQGQQHQQTQLQATAFLRRNPTGNMDNIALTTKAAWNHVSRIIPTNSTDSSCSSCSSSVQSDFHQQERIEFEDRDDVNSNSMKRVTIETVRESNEYLLSESRLKHHFNDNSNHTKKDANENKYITINDENKNPGMENGSMASNKDNDKDSLEWNFIGDTQLNCFRDDHNPQTSVTSEYSSLCTSLYGTTTTPSDTPSLLCSTNVITRIEQPKYQSHNKIKSKTTEKESNPSTTKDEHSRDSNTIQKQEGSYMYSRINCYDKSPNGSPNKMQSDSWRNNCEINERQTNVIQKASGNNNNSPLRDDNENNMYDGKQQQLQLEQERYVNNSEEKSMPRTVVTPFQKHSLFKAIRRWNNRSPSPSRSRQKSECNDADSELVMGVEMHRQFRVIKDFVERDTSFNCGRPTNRTVSRNTTSSSPIVSKSNSSETKFDVSSPIRRKGSSFLPSAMSSCLFPSISINTSEANSMDYERKFGNPEKVTIKRKEQDGQFNHGICSNIASTLLLNVKDDDPLWMRLDNDDEIHSTACCKSIASTLLLDVKDDDPLWTYVVDNDREFPTKTKQTLSIEEVEVVNKEPVHLNNDREQQRASMKIDKTKSSIQGLLVYDNERTRNDSGRYSNAKAPMFTESQLKVHRNLHSPSQDFAAAMNDTDYRYEQFNNTPSLKASRFVVNKDLNPSGLEQSFNQAVNNENKGLKFCRGDRYSKIKSSSDIDKVMRSRIQYLAAKDERDQVESCPPKSRFLINERGNQFNRTIGCLGDEESITSGEFSRNGTNNYEPPFGYTKYEIEDSIEKEQIRKEETRRMRYERKYDDDEALSNNTLSLIKSTTDIIPHPDERYLMILETQSGNTNNESSCSNRSKNNEQRRKADKYSLHIS